MGTGNVANKYAKVSSAMACTNWCIELFSSGSTPRMTISAGMLATSHRCCRVTPVLNT
jgi:hypothetical protein